MAAMASPTIEDVLNEEADQIEASRQLRLGKDDSRSKARERDSLIGLAFSGGGIRSATFNLGILQALARERLLRVFDYISTVSGGGYIGGWLMAWMHHQQIGILELEEKLSKTRGGSKESADPPEVHFLRSYSNYLTPRKGWLGTDFWAFAAGYVRNTLLNQMILVLAFLSLLLVPRSLAYLVYSVSENGRFWLAALFEFLAVLSIGFNLVSIYQIRAEDPNQTQASKRNLLSRIRGSWFRGSSGVQIVIVLPLLLSASFYAYGMGNSPGEWPIKHHPWLNAAALGSGMYLSFWVMALLINKLVRLFERRAEHSDVRYEHPATREGESCGSCRHFIRPDPPRNPAQCQTVQGPNRAEDWCLRFGTKDDTPSVSVILVTAAIAGFITGFLFEPLARVLVKPGTKLDIWEAMTYGTPFIVGTMLITGVLHIGLMGRGLIDKHREWLGRLGGMLMIYAAGWLVLFLIAIYFPVALGGLSRKYKIGSLAVSGLVWVASTTYGVIFGKSESKALSILNATNRQKLWHYLARATPYIFILGVMLGLSLLASACYATIAGNGETAWSLANPEYFTHNLLWACLILFAVSVALSQRVDINEFSSHYLYRNRLIRCYLGASRLERHAQPFTGFSDRDNFPLAHLQIPIGSQDPKDARPLPIVNTSLNVVRGRELAVQTRKARSFAFTPLYGGFTRQKPGVSELEACFGPTREAGSRRTAYRDGITMGTCMAVSGAAASPNMGSYSQSALAFLMTLFDVRLGWWIGNPMRTGRRVDLRKMRLEDPARKWWRSGSPGFGFVRLLCELLGNTCDDSRFLYLSDGGHFENLGIYELVRRRCKVIVACDASCDGNSTMADLHNAMERCRTDFGVTITLENEEYLKPTESQGKLRSKQHFVKGTIHYPGWPDGTIIYIKPTLVDGDPEDVLAYKQVNPSFPHDKTVNQWFDEAHFENYRALGEEAGRTATRAIREAIRTVNQMWWEKIPA